MPFAMRQFFHRIQFKNLNLPLSIIFFMIRICNPSRFEIVLASPDGYSPRLLVFYPIKIGLGHFFVTIKGWKRLEQKQLESTLEKVGCYPAW